MSGTLRVDRTGRFTGHLSAEGTQHKRAAV